ncbi:chromodomain-helicase-DNA-binding protein 7 isoform X2 [Photinus pyralis]|uniref:chromodomain-helicase-DNA-binding protein 7 isoform X2 n=1 Tax=Photinus pyralis TaxID=7054 RepID=UPI001266F9CA|nr:chromodomain-helicase-DNA-binding protein 7 isoform X2 [Photinus pyralis]
MDSYDLFGEDGAGMLEGLPDLGGDHFDPAVTGARDAAPAYAQPTYTQENPLQKLASFGGTDFTHMDPNTQNMYTQGYGTERPMGPPGGPYTHQRQMVRPPAPQATASGQYPYQPDNMYSIPDHQLSMGDAATMQGWGQHSSYPIHRYSQMGSYRQQPMAYGHQQEQKHQFPPTQHPIMQQPHQTTYPMQQRHTPHYPQNTAYPTTAGQAAYTGYMHQRMPHHHQYPQTHHQIEMGVSQAQQYNHMGHNQALSTHSSPHTGPSPGHMPQTHPTNQGHAPPPQQPPAQNHLTHPNSLSYSQTSHQPMQSIQRPMEVSATPQQYPSKHPTGPGGVLGSGSPQYRAPFPQLSPQLSSPRPQMSPRPPAPQMSPRPVMSPAKPNVSPHPQMQQTTLSPRPPTSLTPKSTTASPAPMSTYSQQSTLQALEQMVMPSVSTNNTEYPTYQPRNTLGPPQSTQNPLSPSVGLRNPITEQQWPPPQQQQPPSQQARPLHISNINGSLTLLDQNQGIPPPSQQSLPPSSNVPLQSLQSSQSLEQNFTSEELRGEVNKPVSIPEVSAPMPHETTSTTGTLNLPPVITQSDYSSVRSPISTTMVDKPSSTTNNAEVSTPSSIHDVPISHPPTPTPSSTTDDNAASNQESSLPANVESLKSIEDSSNSSTATQQPTQSQSNATNFTDFTSVSSMTSYNKTPLQPTKINMDDLMPSNMPLYNQEPSLTSLSRDITPTPTTTSQPASLTPLSQVPPQSLMQTNQPQLQILNPVPPPANQMLPNMPQISSVHQTQQPPPTITSNQNNQSNLPPIQNQTLVQSQPPPPPTQHTQNLPPPHPNLTSLTPHSQAQGIFEQNPNSIMGNAGLSIGPPPRSMTHSMPMNMQGMPMGLGAPPVMVPGIPPMLANQDIGYQPPISHHQERAALQQQLQELYCMPPAPENQDKISHLQERLNILAQHEANDQCNGGPQCVLQSPLFTSPMIDSPQVSSTTGRGRGKGGPRAKKPRQKKNEKDAIMQIPQSGMASPMGMMMPQQPLPVSEDCVTPGAGLNIHSGELTEIGMDPMSGEMDLDKQKKGRGSRKPREPKKPKEPKLPKEPKIPKERKKREPKEPKEQRVKRKYVRKKKFDGDDIITDDLFNKSTESGEEHLGDISQTSQSLLMEDFSMSEPGEILPESTREPEQVQADSQTTADGIAEVLSEPETKKDEYTFEDQSNSNEEIEKMIRKTPKRVKPPPIPKKVVSTKARTSRTVGISKGKKRKSVLAESDGEGEDLISTPPPSPPEDADNTTQKRRSARNTQRKKYVDDVMLRFSDDDSPAAPSKTKKTVAPAPPVIAPSQPSIMEILEEPTLVNDAAGNKPNFVYVNTTEDDAMVVQYVLSSRMSKREKLMEVNKDDPAPKPTADDEAEKHTEPSQTAEETEDKIDVTETPAELTEEAKSEGAPEKKFEMMVVDVEEYYVKYRNFSYLHCEWRTEEELYKGDKRIANKIKRFKQKQQQQLNIFEYLDDEPFNPDYLEVDRVLDVAEHTDPNTQETIKHYLVKWRSLQYEDSTWELEEDVDPLKIQQFLLFRAIPPKDRWKPKRRQHPDLWLKLEQSPIYKGGNILREYQLEGLNWLLFSWHNGRNCILADEMGLGKTIQSLTFIHAVHEFGIRGPFLIIAPLSTIPNWQREIEAWTELNVIVYHGSSASRNMLQEYEYFYKNEKGQPIKEITKFNILITTFEIIVTDFADLKGFNWRVCIIDEAHRLKNRNCKLLEGLRQLNLEHRVLLSGTPLQNNVNELFSLLNFLEPTQFANSEQFLQEFGALKSEQEVQKLQCILKPMMLRRLKEDVEKSLAPKEETVVEVELTNIQKKYYRGILERNFSFLQKGTTQANIPNLMNTMMELRKCCIHPYLLNGAEDQIQYDFKMQHGEDVDAYYKALINSSGKMVLIDKLLPKLRANGHRVLIFSQMVRCLDILEDYLMYRKYPFERIDGRIRGNLRQAAIDRFSRPDSDRFIFLLCTKAGGLGINLTAADTVIIYDSDWNPQNDLQAQARCHRIGQQKMVKIYRLLCRNTYEREMFDKASLKLGLDKAVLQSMNTSQGGKESGNRQLSKKEIEDLLKKGAYGALLDEEDGDKFCEEDIDMILARRTQVITMESEKGSTFSKASFASSANRSDINIDDPDFWNKWAKRADIDTTEKDETEDLVLSEPRRRTQIKRYGHDESAIDMSELESSTDSDGENEGLTLGMRSRRSKKLKKKLRSDDYMPREGERGDIVYGSWARRECFMVERGLLTFGWGRWREILDHSQLRKGWKESDIEDCARVILLYCLRFYRGDEKIRSFIWDLITPCEYGEGMKITRNHHGLKDPVPRGIRNKNKKKSRDSRHAALTDPNHWSKNEKYDGDIFLESNYKKHLGRHANKVLLRVRMLYYIKHEIIGDLVQHIADGVHASALPVNPPITEQLPCEWWDSECDKSLLVGTWKHGYENYTEMRADPTLCFLSRCGPPSARELQLASNTQPPTPALNDDDLDDEDTNEEFSLKSRFRDLSELNSEIAEPSPGPSGSSETQPSGDPDDRLYDDLDDKQMWPSATDLNTRLRRVITSYQRSYRKEEQQKLAKIKPASVESALSSPLAALAQVSQQLDARDAASLAMPGWDLQQLALYLLMERQGKHLEQAVREKERHSIARKWTRREEADFFRVVSSYGVNYFRKKKAYDWIKFKQLAKLDKKSDDEITDYYKNFVVMCKRQTGVKLDDDSYDTTIEHISEEKARRTLERLELLSRIREEIVTHPKLDDRLKVCATSADMPEWWLPGKHDKDLLLGVAKHGLGRTDYYILNDPELSFQEILRKKVSCTTSESLDSKDAIKLESHEDILKFDKNEILVKLEKGEGTLKIEKVNIKKENLDDKDKEKKKEDSTKIELTLVKSESKEESEVVEKQETTKTETEGASDQPSASVEISELQPSKVQESEANEINEKEEQADETKKKDTDNVTDKPNKKELEDETDICAKQAAELKAMFPDLEVIQPLSRLSQVDTFVLRDKQGTGALDFSETTVAQLFNNAVKWPREYAIQVRLQHIVYAIETKEWPASKSFSAYANGIGGEFDIPIHEIPNDPPKRETSTPLSLGDSEIITITTDNLHRNSLHKKRKRHIAIDVETERAKLHALLNSSHGMLPNPLPKPNTSWDNDDSEDSRRSTPVTQSLQPPPAHQQTGRLLTMPYELKYHAPKTIGQTSVIPGTSSTLTPIDLSSGLPKMNNLDIPKVSSHDIQNEVQDFSLKKHSNASHKMSGNKLDDTLSKLMKRKNCPIEEPVVGKEKKRRKLDEIVLGLSAAKEQMLYPETTKKSTVAPSVTVTPTSAPLTSSHHQKPFTITVTSIPSPAPPPRSCATPNLKSPMPGKDSFSNFLVQAEQQNLLLKKQQQQQKSYEAMIADINKVADFSSKVNSYSHEAKVNKWLAEQNAALAEQPLNADYLTPRRRRPRVDPSLLDWKKLTGNENVSVIHRVTNKKLTGPKAPTLKRLGQWLMENPMYDIDPKWAELVKERGNLGHDMQKRFSNSSVKKSTPGRPPLLSSPTGSTSSVSSANMSTSLASSLPFPSLAGSSLSGLNSSLLSGLSGLGQFDSKNMLFDPKNPLFDPKNPLFDPKNNPLFDPKNPLLMPFAGGMPNMNALNSMAGLGNLGNMNLFANLAGLGLPGMGMDPVPVTPESAKPKTSTASTTGGGTESKSGKSQKPIDVHSGNKSAVSSSPATSLPSSTPFPFFFPNPSLLYTPLGLGGLNPFALQPGMSAYDTLAQQCNLLNGNLNPAASPNSTKSTKASRSPSVTSTSTTATQSKSPRPNRDSHLQNLILPPDTQLLESLSKVSGTLDTSNVKHKADRKDEKNKTSDSMRGMLPSDYSGVDKFRGIKDLPNFADFNKLLEATQAQIPTQKKMREQEIKEAFDKLTKGNPDVLTRTVPDEQRATPTPKRQRDPNPTEVSDSTIVEDANECKRFKESDATSTHPTPVACVTSTEVDIETLLPPSTVVKSSNPTLPAENDNKQSVPTPPPPLPQHTSPEPETQEIAPVEPVTQSEPMSTVEPTPKKNAKRTRGKRRSGDVPLDPETVIERKNLRSSASRSAAVAAAKQAAAKQLEAENALKNHDG